MNNGPRPMNNASATSYSKSIEPAVTAGPPVPMPINHMARVFALSSVTSLITSSASTLDSASCM
ncbi:hypothetical protein D3C75_1028170 [compost metagenome]